MPDRIPRRSPDTWLALVIGASTLALLVVTLDEPSMTWDEGFTIDREEIVRAWFHLLRSPPPTVTRRQLFDEQVIHKFWPFAREEPDGHPPFYAIVGDLGWFVSHDRLPPLEAHRFGPVALFSFTVGVMYLFMARRGGRLAGLAAAGSWLLMPRVFAHAHLASYDVPLACLWFLSVAAFWKAWENWTVSFRSGLAWSVIFAVILALAAATKFTGWLIPWPLLVWTAGVGFTTLRREGKACLKKPVLLSILLWIYFPLVFVEWRMLREINKIESGVEHVPNENPKRRAVRVADLFRSEPSPLPLRLSIYVPAATWTITVACIAVLRRLYRSPKVNPAATTLVHGPLGTSSGVAWGGPPRPLPEIWTAAAALAPAITIALVPTWWHDPLRGIAVFLWSNLSRQKTTWIPTQFFGTTYEFALPWYNTLAWVGLTVPPGILALILIGVVRGILGLWNSREEGEHGSKGRGEKGGRGAGETEYSVLRTQYSSSFAGLLLLNAATVLVIRALPNAPGHDGERQLLGSFPFLACLAGVGAEWLRSRLAQRVPLFVANWTARGLVAFALCWAAAAVWHYRPVQLSYYTELIGGVRGAERLGLEPTYYWDALDETALNWLNSRTGPGERILFCNYPQSFEYLKRWGKLRMRILPDEPGVLRWYILQNRPGLFTGRPWDRWLARHGEAAFTRRMDGVPLLWIFPFEEYEKATRETRRNAEIGGAE